MKTAARKRKLQESGDDLWAWAERREVIIREEPPARPGWYRGLINKISGRRSGP